MNTQNIDGYSTWWSKNRAKPLPPMPRFEMAALSDQTPTRTRSTEANESSSYSEAIDLQDATSALYWLLDQTCLLQRCRELSAVVGLPVEELDGAIAELNDMVAAWEATHLPVVA